MTGADHPQPDLFVVVADADVKALLDRLLLRGVDRKCLRPLRWEIRRDPMRDSGVRRSPLSAVPDLRPGSGKLLVILDHHGCGNEAMLPATVEEGVSERLMRAGFGSDDAVCLVLAPELEEVLVPVWDRVAALMAEKRNRAAPPNHEILASLGYESGADWPAVLVQKPKECFVSLLKVLRLRHQTALYADIGAEVSLNSLKQTAVGRRLGAVLVRWFGVS